jgi:hypothetical protein
MEIEEIKLKQEQDLKAICDSKGVEFNSMKTLLDSERIKKLQKRNHYINQSINVEIEKVIENENK